MRRREWIAEWLKQIDKTQRGLADELGISRPAVSDIISGKRKVQSEEIEPMADYLGLSETDLLKRLDAKRGKATQLSGKESGSKPIEQGLSPMTNTANLVLKTRIKALLSDIDTTSAALLVDEIIQERITEDQAPANPPKRARR